MKAKDLLLNAVFLIYYVDNMIQFHWQNPVKFV